MTVEERIRAAIQTRNTTCTAAWAAMDTWQPVAHPEPEPFRPSDLETLLTYHRSHAAMTQARATYYAAVAEADAALVAGIESAMAEGAGK